MTGASCVRLKLDGTYLNGVNMTGCRMIGKNTLVCAARLKGAIMPDGCRYDGSFCLDDDLKHLEKHCARRKLDTSDVDVVAEWYGVELDIYAQGQEWAVKHLAAVRAGAPEFVGEYESVR
jgi:hypothetical protein